MRLRYGGYWFDSGAVAVATAKETVFDTRGFAASERHTFSMRGTLTPDVTGTAAQQQANLTAKCAALERALRLQGLDLVMYDDGGGVAFSLPNVRALGGTRITRGPNYPESSGAEYVNYRTFDFTAEAEFPLTATGVGGTILVAFTETLSFSGGGPVNDFIPVVNVDPVPVELFARTPYRARQAGSAVALGTWPVAPTPLWPQYLLRNGEPTIVSPQRGARGLEYGITWSYEFGSVRPLLGRPNPWVGSG